MVNAEQQQNDRKRFTALKDEHQQRVSAYIQLSDYINPTRGIFNGNRTKIGQMIDHKKLLSSYSTHALRIFASGMNSGMTNKSSQWFRVTLDNNDYLEIPGVREALDALQDTMYAILNHSNVYGVFYSAYEEMGQFGPACFLILEDFEDVIRARSFTAGEYFLGTDNKGRVNAFAREFEMTVDQVVREFGLESCSSRTKAMHQNKQLDQKIKICHIIVPNDGRDTSKEDYLNMAYRSAYWEDGNDAEGYLSERGYKRFPVIAPRWDVITTDDPYGYGPGWHAIGSIKELQKTRKDKLIVQDKVGNPPIQQDASVVGHANLLPGGVTKVTSNLPNAGVRPAYEVPPAIDMFMQAIQECKEEIDRFFFVNLFLMLMNMDASKMTATEVAERQQEKIMMMGPALHRLDEEMLTPTLELLYGIMEDNGLLPEFPEQMQGVQLKLEYTSILAQAQRALGVTKIERVLGLVGQMAPLAPEIMDNIDVDEVAHIVNDLEGAPAKIIRPKDQRDAMREQRAKMQQAAQAAELANSAADTTNKLANAPMDQQDQSSALDKMMAGVGK